MWQNWSKRTHRGLRSCILYSLESSPKTGAELMDAVEAMSQGWWRPSPGSVYPLLESMAGEGAIRRVSGGKYALAEAGRRELSGQATPRTFQPRTAKEVVAEMSHYTSYLEDIGRKDAADVKAQSREIASLRDRLGSLLEG